MPSQLSALCLDANDPLLLARFWAGVLGWKTAGVSPHGLPLDPAGGPLDPAGVTLDPVDDTGFSLRFVPRQEQKARPNPLHLHLTSTSLEDQQQTVDRALDLGARHVDVGQRPEEGHIVLADPEDNEFSLRPA
jgi:hypothetical protein